MVSFHSQRGSISQLLPIIVLAVITVSIGFGMIVNRQSQDLRNYAQEVDVVEKTEITDSVADMNAQEQDVVTAIEDDVTTVTSDSSLPSESSAQTNVVPDSTTELMEITLNESTPVPTMPLDIQDAGPTPTLAPDSATAAEPPLSSSDTEVTVIPPLPSAQDSVIAQTDSAPACKGDVTGDGKVTTDDISLFVPSFANQPEGSPALFDLDGNGIVDIHDFTVIIANFSCGQ